MKINKGKHEFGVINEVRVTFVEKKISMPRVEFLKKLLEHNGFECLSEEDKKKKEEDPTTFSLGVTDMTFNPVIAVYQRKLLTFEGQKVTPDYWNEKTDQPNPNYWDLEKKGWLKEAKAVDSEESGE